MNDHPVLSQIALGYSPMIDRHRAVTAVRLAVFPLRPDHPPHAAELLAAVAEVWPPEGGRVSLNIVSETLLQELMGAEPPTNLMVEVPAFMACDPVHSAALQALYKRGNTLLIKGRPLAPLPREVLPCFAYSIVDVADERRDGQPAPGGVTRTIPHVQSGVTTLEAMEAAFSRGAIAVLGWPMEGILGQGQRAGEPQLQQIVELINRVDRGESLDRLEEVLRTDPTLAYRLIRTMNSPAFGLPVEVSSFRHAIMLLGHQRLKRWLALLLASASKDPNMKPVMYSALRRGLLMEELSRGGGGDADRSAEMFICGVFSLLDKMMGEPFDRLLASIPVPPAVRAALVDEAGPYRPYLELVMAVEASSVYDIRAAADAVLLAVSEVNHAVLRALSAARQID